MRIFDLHVDTLSKLKQGISFTSSILGWSEGDLSAYDSVTLVTAAFADPHRSDGEAYLDFFTMCELQRELKEKTRETPLTLILSVEDGRILEGRPERLPLLYEAGVRILTPFWRGESCLGGAFDTERGLTEFGRRTVKDAEKLGMILDLSHASDASFFEVASLATRPLIASHSASRAVRSHPRNLTDEQFLFFKEHRGLVGLPLYPPHLTEKAAPDMTALLPHMEHFLALGGCDNLALGTDLDGIDESLSDIASGRDLTVLAELLAKEGYSDCLIRRLFYENAQRFFALHLKP